MKTLQKEDIDEFKVNFPGDVLLPGDADYDEVRQIWNAMIDRKPGLIARCVSPEDVVQAVKFARKHNLLVSIRGGGHNIAGNAVCDDGLMIDLSLMKSVQVDPDSRRATVEPGCTLADIDAATQAHGLATPLGINSTTGVAGLTLGGGFGWLSRKYGMTVDNLLSAEVVTAEGKRVHASETANADLFWGASWWWWEFWYRYQLRVPAPSRRAQRAERAYRLSVRPGEVRAYAFRPIHRDDAGRPLRLDGHPAGPPTSLPA